MFISDDSFDFLRKYKTPHERLIAARSALSRTPHGMNGVIRVELDNDNLKFILNMTGQAYDNIGQAINKALEFNISETLKVTPTAAGNKLSGLAEAVKGINQTVSGLDSSQKAILKNAGIDIDNLGTLDLTISTLRADKGGAQKVAKQITEMRNRGEKLGITMMDDEGARVINFSVNGQLLSSQQAHLLLAASGREIAEIPGVGKDLATELLKVGKRVRTLTSEREIALAGSELSKILSGDSEKLIDRMLVIDRKFDLLKKYAHENLDKGEYTFGGNKQLEAIYRGKDPLDYIGSYVETLSEKERRILSEIIDSYMGPSNSKDLKKYVEAALSGAGKNTKQNSKILKAFSSSMASIEYAGDGQVLFNKFYLDKYAISLEAEKKALEKIKNDKTKPEQVRREAAESLQKIRNILNQMQGSNLDDVVFRGHLAGVGDMKASASITSAFFDMPELDGIIGIIDSDAIKGGTKIANKTDQILLSGFGHPRDLVYLDPVASAMHGEIFNDPETVEAIRRRGLATIEEFKGAIEQGVLPEKMRSMLERTASIDVGALPLERRSTSMRAKQYAAKILQMHQSGISPRQAPNMLNMIAQIYATEMYREKDGILQTVLPETQRYSLSTEAFLPGESRLGRGFTKLRSTYEDVQGNKQLLDADVINFRIKGHTMYFGGEAVGQTRHVLGGFDLDDKGIAKLFRYTDDKGMARIAFHMIRQPTSIDEIMVGRALMDEDTVRAIANNKFFNEAMLELLNPLNANVRVPAESKVFNVSNRGKKIIDLQAHEQAKAAAEQYRAVAGLQRMVSEGMTIEKAFASSFEDIEERYRSGKIGKETRDRLLARRRRTVETRIEGAVEAVYRQMEEMGLTKTSTLSNEAMQRAGARPSTKGFMPLRVTDIEKEPQFSRQGVFKVLQKNEAFDLSEEIKYAINQMPVDLATKNRFLATRTSDELVKLFEEDAIRENPAIIAAFNQAFEERTIKSITEGGDILGTYVNRTMVVGSTLNQIEEMISSVTNKDVQEYLLKNFQIGLVGSEEAIDSSINVMGLTKAVRGMKEMAGALEQSAAAGNFHSLKGVEKALMELADIGKGGIGVVGETAISGVGKLIGATRVLGIGDEYQIGLDRALLAIRSSGGSRLSNEDLRVLVEGVISGMQEASEKSGLVSADVQKLTSERIDQFRQVVKTSSDEALREFVEEQFTLKAGQERFMSMSHNIKIAEELKGYLEATTRNMRRMTDNSMIRNAAMTERSNLVARNILEQNKESLDFIFSDIFASTNSFATEASYTQILEKQRLEAQILRQIDEASKLKGMSMETLINSIDALTVGSDERAMRRIDIGSLTDAIAMDKMGLDNYDELTEAKITQARALRSIKHYQKYSDDMAKQLRAQISGNTMSEVEDSVRAILDNSSALDDYTTAVYEQFLGRTSNNVREEVVNEAIIDANILRSKIIEEQMAQQISALTQAGDIESAEALARELGDDPTLTDEFFNALDDSDNYVTNKKATYKRFSDAVKDGDIKKLFSEPLIKRGTLAIGALVLGSFAYSAYKDRTHDDMSGPPLLPGGSAYELDYPTRIPEIANFRGFGYVPGVSYNISVNGSQEDIDFFNEQASGLVNGALSTTIYKGIPNINQDPYSAIASSY